MNTLTLLYLLPCLLLVIQNVSTVVPIGGPNDISKSSNNNEYDPSRSIASEDQSPANEKFTFNSIVNIASNMASKINDLQKQVTSLVQQVQQLAYTTMTPNDVENPINETLFTSTKNTFSKILSNANYSPFTKTILSAIVPSNKNNKKLQPRNSRRDININSEETDDEINEPNSNKLTRTQTMKVMAYDVLRKGAEFKKQYGNLMPQLITLTLPGGQIMNVLRVISVLPFVILALQKVNAPVVEQETNPMAEFDKLNLSSILENPEKLIELFKDKKRAEFIIESMKVMAGSDASTVVDNLMTTVANNAKDINDRNGEIGITGDHLTTLFTTSTSFKNLFKGNEDYYQGLNLLNAIVGSTLNPESKKTKITIIKQLNDSLTQGENNKIIDVVKGTLKDSVSTYFKVGQTIINNKVNSLNVEADKNVDNWKLQGSGNTFTGKMKNIVVNNAPDEALKLVAKGYVISGLCGSFVIPRIAKYFLPIGVGMDVLKFMCLTTYVMHVAKKNDVIPNFELERLKKMGYDTDKISVLGINAQEINTGKIVDLINKADNLKKNSLFEKYSSSGVNVLRFLAGPEASMVDNIADQLKAIKKGKNNEQLTLTDIIQNTEFFKKLYNMKEFTDDKIKRYLGMDVGQLTNDVLEEMNKDNGENIEKVNNSMENYYGVPGYLSRAGSAVYTVGTRNISDKIETIKAEFQKGLSASQSTNTGYLTSIKSNQYLQSGLSLVNRYKSSLFSTAK